MTRRQDPPNTIKFELTEGCNLRCGMCGIQGIRDHTRGPFLFMTVARADAIAVKIAAAGWTSKLELAMHGEPLLNPDAAAIIAVLRRHLPKNQIMMTSNGTPLLRPPGPVDNAVALFNAGLNVLAIDCYRETAKVEAILRRAIQTDVFTKHGVQAFDYPGPPGESPYQRGSAKERRLFLIEDFERASMEGLKVGTKLASNHCGAGLPSLLEPLKARCARPFRELTVRWDGRVPLCCNDWRGAYHAGDLTKQTAQEVWDGAPLRAARVRLYNRDRDFSPCRTCDDKSYRVGLLPDRMGRQTLPRVTAEVRAETDKASERRTMTVSVLRPWERVGKGGASPVPDPEQVKRMAEELAK